jgi:L-ribulokinase
MPLHLIASEQGPALGSAMFAAVAAGAYPDIYAASTAMASVTRDAFVPDPVRADAYDALYQHYARLHDHFGRGGDDVMHRLRDLRPRELAHG